MEAMGVTGGRAGVRWAATNRATGWSSTATPLPSVMLSTSAPRPAAASTMAARPSTSVSTSALPSASRPLARVPPSSTSTGLRARLCHSFGLDDEVRVVAHCWDECARGHRGRQSLPHHRGWTLQA